MTRYEWCTTLPNPRSSMMGYDAGQRGWRLHAVPLRDGESDIPFGGRRTALCGMWPSHGWGLDLFIEDRCKRCAAALARVGGAA